METVFRLSLRPVSIFASWVKVKNTMATRGQQAQGAIVPGTADHFGALVVNSGKNFVKTHPRISIAWVVGLLISILASGFTPSQEAVQKYEVCL